MKPISIQFKTGLALHNSSLVSDTNTKVMMIGRDQDLIRSVKEKGDSYIVERVVYKARSLGEEDVTNFFVVPKSNVVCVRFENEKDMQAPKRGKKEEAK